MTRFDSPAAEARRALGARLRRLRRRAAGLTGRALGELIDIHFTRVSKFENGALLPNDRRVRAWCAACDAEGEADLLATLHAVDSAYVEWHTRVVGGMKGIGGPAAATAYDGFTRFLLTS
ncbi:hypothetical protein GCM10010123_27800 [Pilimelia anulata]|uniref:HTH cro/C1-type domain-containing protein n=1 Tax=Pilimelia anulata TaxID=53371 RepID=A0A8J3B5Y8_9ACTN|nr:helix-turn-helix domain-containing protein [Pilimelia anulata]GGJ96271.1 hypothetical protein GCM10010123_27800 [Pilimelia anulata]